MSRVSFREAGRSDSPAVAALHAASWRDVYRGILPEAYLDGPIFAEKARYWDARLSGLESEKVDVFLAERDQTLLGFACVLLDREPDWGACLDNLHVAPESRGQGIGRRLFGLAAGWVERTAPGLGLYLWVFEANPAARRFYDALGGRVAERQVRPLPGGALVPSLRYVWPDMAALLARLDG